jgi:MFS family permease
MTGSVELKAQELNKPELTPRSMAATVGATIGFMVGPGSIIAPPIGLFMIPVATEFGFGRAGFPLLMLMVSIFAGTVSPLAGRAIDRFGVRRVIIPAVILSGLAQLTLWGTAGSAFAFIAVMALIGALAGIQNPVAYTRVLSLWFSHRRGFMIAIAAALGTGGGGIIVPQLVERLIGIGGWRLGYAGLGVFILLGVPLLIWLLREPATHIAKRVAVGHAPSSLSGCSLKQAMATPTFWMIMLALVAASASLVALSVHVPAWIADAGGSSGVAASFLSLLALGSIAGQLGSGYLLDRIPSAKIGAPFFVIAACGAGILTALPPTSPWIPFAGLMAGMSLGAELGLASYVVSRYFGLRCYGQIYGFVYGAMVIASGAGPVIMGVAFEINKDYLPAFGVTSIALLISFLMFALLPSYKYKVGNSHDEQGNHLSEGVKV